MPTSKKQHSFRYFLTTLLSGIAVSFGAFLITLNMIHLYEKKIADEQTNHFISLSEIKLKQIISDLRFMAEFFYASETVTQDEFSSFAQNYYLHDGITHLSWISATDNSSLSSWKSNQTKSTLLKNTSFDNILHKFHKKAISTEQNGVSLEITQLDSTKDTESIASHPFLAITLPITNTQEHLEQQEGTVIILLDITRFFESLLTQPDNRNIIALEIQTEPSAQSITIGHPWGAPQMDEQHLRLQNMDWNIRTHQTIETHQNLLSLFPGTILLMGVLIAFTTSTLAYPRDSLRGQHI